MSQIALLAAPRPVLPPGIDLRCCGVDVLLSGVRGARLVYADPPWRYAREAGAANPESNGIYNGLPERQIAEHLDASFDCAKSSARLAVWYTWPKDAEWTTAGGAGPRWGARTTGGAWLKTGSQVGVGYHWRGRTEPVALFTTGATGRPSEILANGFASEPEGHSEKPIPWLRAWVRAWTEPGDLVLDLYAGLGGMARACVLEGRRYVGAEIDLARHRRAVDLLACLRVPASSQGALFAAGGGR